MSADSIQSLTHLVTAIVTLADPAGAATSALVALAVVALI
jgi:hypothetical protein